MRLLLLVALSPLVMAADPPKAKVTIGKDTTVVEGPLTADGYIDYAAALNTELGKGVTPQTNAQAVLIRAFGPMDLNERAAAYFKALGIEPLPEQGDYYQKWSLDY